MGKPSKIKLYGLRNVLRKFNESGTEADGTHWKMNGGGYDLWWQLGYKGFAWRAYGIASIVVECVDGELHNCGLDENDFDRVCKVIFEEYCKMPIAEE